MVSDFHWDEAKKAFVSLYQKTFDPFEKQKILADMNEWMFLSGESFNINDLLNDKESCQC